ncbi:unnamed protein product [Calypogeia fissa]
MDTRKKDQWKCLTLGTMSIDKESKVEPGIGMSKGGPGKMYPTKEASSNPCSEGKEMGNRPRPMIREYYEQCWGREHDICKKPVVWGRPVVVVGGLHPVVVARGLHVLAATASSSSQLAAEKDLLCAAWPEVNSKT